MSIITFSRPDGGDCPGYLAEPTQRSNGRGIVLIHEIWGLAPPVIEVAERCAAAGYRVLVPDLFRGSRAIELQQGLALMAALDLSEAVEQDLRGAAQRLKRSESKLATLGFSMGGMLAIIAGARVPELDATICFYGLPAPDVVMPTDLQIPLQCHFAQLDEWCTPAKVDVFEAGLRAARASYELHRYDAAPAFMNGEGPAYSAAAAELAWQRVLDFLDRKLGG